MFKTSFRIAATLTVVSIAAFMSTPRLDGAEFFRHRGRRCNEGGIEARGYRVYDEIEADRVIAFASVDQPERVTQYAARPGYPGQRVEIAVDRKLFPVNVTSITAAGVSLARMAVTLYSDGSYRCTGLLSFDGGPEESLHGANAGVRVRAYSAAPQQEAGLLNARLLWESSRHFFVRRGQPLASSLLPESGPPVDVNGLVAGDKVYAAEREDPSSLILRHFSEITHVEIILERYTDR